MLSLSGRHAIITGGSRGIGLAIAYRFASEGASVTLLGRNQDTLNQAVQSLAKPWETPEPLDHGSMTLDVRHSQEWGSVVRNIRQQGKPIDILVNAAGISQNSFLFKSDTKETKDIVDANLMGTIYGCQTVIPMMMKQKNGCILNISSLLATHAGRGASVYAASKAGIVGLTRSLAWEVGRFGIRCNVILPGYIQTDMTKPLDDKGDLSALIPLGRMGQVEEVADAAAFLVKNPYAHNTVLNLDGGLSAT